MVGRCWQLALDMWLSHNQFGVGDRRPTPMQSASLSGSCKESCVMLRVDSRTDERGREVLITAFATRHWASRWANMQRSQCKHLFSWNNAGELWESWVGILGRTRVQLQDQIKVSQYKEWTKVPLLYPSWPRAMMLQYFWLLAHDFAIIRETLVLFAEENAGNMARATPVVSPTRRGHPLDSCSIVLDWSTLGQRQELAAHYLPPMSELSTEELTPA